ncbi:hypothetical protein EYF80_031189 [Liparis tanakae]|uniref:Uncharacterized protein n=1 Tax=Liparis tanakae TaxID=230148 RepID=A0A4Z2GYN7_9TELE|nr:hypothetical protein EYF80_031189 [Liparis tanakae]
MLLIRALQPRHCRHTLVAFALTGVAEMMMPCTFTRRDTCSDYNGEKKCDPGWSTISSAFITALSLSTSEVVAVVNSRVVKARHPEAGRWTTVETTPCFLPVWMKASTQWSMSSSVWAAEIWTRILALPFGTTGKENPIT